MFDWNRRRHQFHRLSIGTRILALYALCAAIAVWFINGYAEGVILAHIEGHTELALEAASEDIAREIDAEIRQRAAALQALAADLPAAVTADSARARAWIEGKPLAQLLFSEGLLLTDANQRIIADYPAVAGRSGASVAGRDYATGLADGRAYALGRPTIGAYTQRPSVILAVPVASRGALLLGAIGLSDDDIFATLVSQHLGRKGYALVLSPRYRLVVAASDASRRLEALPAAGSDPLLDQRLAGRLENIGPSSSWNGSEALTASRRIASADWLVVVGTAKEEMKEDVAAIKRKTLVTSAAIAVGIVLLLFLVQRREMAPLVRTTASIRAMTEGRTGFAPLTADAGGEIGELVTSFNAVVAERLHLEAQLRQASTTLEERIAARTAELQTANRELDREARERGLAQDRSARLARRLRDLARRFVDVEENERRRLAREMHDRVSSSLMAIGLTIGLIKNELGKKDNASLAARLEDLSGLVKDTALAAREISSALRPAALEYDGLGGVVLDYAQRFAERTGIAVTVDRDEQTPRLAPERETAMFRIFQEALLNCAKHAQAKRIEVSLRVVAGRVRLVVSDDGVGFDSTAPTGGDKAPGLGLLSMRERAEFAGGSFSVESQPGTGTRIMVEL